MVWGAEGRVAGTVYDAANGQPLTKVAVTARGEVTVSAVTDMDGRYLLKLPAGTYELRFEAPKYLSATVEKTVVKPDEVTEASTLLVTAGTVTTVEVRETMSAQLATAEATLMERKLAPVISDILSSEEIHQSVASDAAGALRKATGVSIVDSGYVYVRGLGERYSSTMLNNAVIPTTEPEKRVVPLDLFPSSLIDGIRVVKSYTPDLPGEFSAGVVQLSTIEFPTEKVLRFSGSTGYNTVTTGSEFMSYPGGGHDFFGFDDGTRALPSLIPTDQRIVQGKYTSSQLQTFGRAFADNWEPVRRTSMRPPQSYSIVGGNTFGRVGVVGALTFSNKPQHQAEIQRYLRQGGTGAIVFTNYEDFQGDTESVRMGGVLNVAMKVNEANKLVIRNTMTRDTDKEAREFKGYDGTNDGTLWSQRLRWVERGLLSTSVEGNHSFARLGNSLLKWQFTYGSSTRDEPDTREVIRGQLDNGKWIYLGLAASGQRFFSALDDQIYEPQVEWSRPFYSGPVTGVWSVGVRSTIRRRNFQARRFRYVPQRASTLDLYASSNTLFAEANIRSDGFQILETTTETDRYTADMDVHAGFAMADVNLGPRWRVQGGVRIEDADILVRTIDPLVPNASEQLANLVNRDPMPAVNVTYSLTRRQNLRGSYAHTVSRPDFRELSPFAFNNVFGGYITQGNAALKRATIHNADLRWEWFPGSGEVVAVSAFAKQFHDPIEVTIMASNDLRQTYINAEGARNVGFELEARTTLGRLSRRLREVGVQGNFSFVDSNIRIRPEDLSVLTSQKRALIGQSRYVGNVSTDWRRPRWHSEARLDANFVSRRISDVGTYKLPDVYQEGGVFLDASYQYTFGEKGRYGLKVSGENLADNHYHWTQASITQRSYRLGRTVMVGFTLSLF